MSEANATLNSCEIPGLPAERYCSSHGTCVRWLSTSAQMQEAAMDPYFTEKYVPTRGDIAFCRCSRDWADPECRTRRKSQQYAYLLSLFLGPFGVDRYYLGEPLLAALKFATLGGGLFWWVADVVYIGSSPPYSGNFRLAHDLPHWAFVASASIFFAAVGFFVFTLVETSWQKSRMRAQMIHEAEDEFHETRRATLLEKPMDTTIGMPTYASINVLTPVGYGAIQATPPGIVKASQGNPWSAWWIRHTVPQLQANRFGPRLEQPSQRNRDLSLHEAVPVCSVPAVPTGMHAQMLDDDEHASP